MMLRLRRKFPARSEVLSCARFSDRKSVRGQTASSVGRFSGDQARWNTCFFTPGSSYNQPSDSTDFTNSNLICCCREDSVYKRISILQGILDDFCEVFICLSAVWGILKIMQSLHETRLINMTKAYPTIS